MIASITTKQAKNPTILPNSDKASFFLPSKYKPSGSDKNRNPITAADSTKSPNITIGINIVSLGKRWFVKFMRETMKAM